MTIRSLLFTLAPVFALIPIVPSQTSAPQPAAKPDYSAEASVIEQMSTLVSFDNDGNRTREQTTRVRVKTDAGVQQWGLLAISFQSAVETADLSYVRVLKSDNTTVTTPPDNIQDLDAQVTRDAPFYSDLREKHVAVKGLAKGDVLEYQVRWRPTKPLIPGQFWFEYDFQHQGIVLDERVEIKVPAERAVKFKGPSATQSVKADGATAFSPGRVPIYKAPRNRIAIRRRRTQLLGVHLLLTSNSAASRPGLRLGNGTGRCKKNASSPHQPSVRRPPNSPRE